MVDRVTDRALLGALALLLTGSMSGAQPPPDDAASVGGAPVAWAELRYRASKLLLSATTTLRQREVPLEAAREELVAADSAVAPGDATVSRVELSTDLPFGRRQFAVVWIDPSTGAALQVERTARGGRPSWKRMRFLADGMAVWRAEPGRREERRLAPDAWTRRKEQVVRWPPRASGGAAVASSYALLPLVAAARLDRPGSRLELLVAGRNELLEVVFEAGELTQADVDYTRETEGARVEVRGKTTLREVRGLAVVAGHSSKDELEVLGLRLPIVLRLEPGTGLPVEIEGEADGVGRLIVRLERAVIGTANETEESSLLP